MNRFTVNRSIVSGSIAWVLPVCLAAFCMTTAVADDEPRFFISAGMEFTSGSYGSSSDIEDFYLPLSATLDYGRTAFRLTVPYLRVRAPEGTQIVGPGGQPIPGTGDIVTNSGLGDVTASFTLYDVIRDRRLGLALDLKGAVKLGTADENKGLGTGETDFTLQADLLKYLDRVTLLASLGYKLRGDTAQQPLDDALLATVGMTYRVSEQTRTGLMLDYQEAARPDFDAQREMSAYVSHRVSDDWKVLGYVIAGFSDSSPDFGAGLQVKRRM